MNKIAVLFDCDGLMFNTEKISQKMWYQEAEKFHTSIPDTFFQAITGAKRDEDFLMQFQEIDHLEDIIHAVHVQRFDLKFWGSYAPDGLNKKGLIELYQFLKANGNPMAVCSSSSRTYVECLLNTVSIPLQFDAVIGGDMVKHGKPDPEIFLKAAQMLEMSPEECLVLEDSKQGILAAKHAGMHSCFIQDTIEPDEEMKAAVEFQRDDLSQVIDIIKEGERNGLSTAERTI